MSVRDAARQPAERLDHTLETLRREGRVGLMAHLVFGYPSPRDSAAIVDAMARAGADIVEVQVPFSDPTADGPVITQACQKALDAGARVEDAFRFVEDTTRRHALPVLMMSYFNLAFAYRSATGGGAGLGGFVARAAAAGASGLIIPDLPPEERQEGYAEACREHGVHAVCVVSPNIGEERLRAVGAVGSGLLYATSRTGTTGKEMDLEMERLTRFLALARQVCGLPLAVGFSISRREQIESLRGHADVAVVGTHLIRAFERGGVAGLEAELRKLRG